MAYSGDRMSTASERAIAGWITILFLLGLPSCGAQNVGSVADVFVADDTGDATWGEEHSPDQCGNGEIEAGEQCDDGNLYSGDGCSAACVVENAQWHVESPATSPCARQSLAMVYHSVRGLVVLFGGGATLGGPEATLNDLWTLEALTWFEATPASSPTGRNGHGLAYDSQRDRLVLFGGGWIPPSDPLYVCRNDTWEHDGVEWTEVTPQISPRARRFLAMAYDAARGRLVLFGGSDWDDGFVYLGDTWEYDGEQWLEISPVNSPSPRAWHAMTYDSDRGRVVLFGGWDDYDFLSDTWEYDGVQWSEKSPALSPSVRANHTLAYDSDRGRVVLFGGYNYGLYNDTWEYDGEQWREITPTARPPERNNASMVYDAGRGMIVLFGGKGALGEFLGDTWTYGY